MTWLGVDLGDARVGLALSDPEHTFAHPAGNIQAYGDSFRTFDDVIDVVEEQHIERIFVGLPLQLNGSEGKSAKKARRWALNLEKRLAELIADDASEIHEIPSIELIDERLTTVSAHQQLREAQISTKSHRPFVDQQSAVMILQSALDCADNKE